jgi:hypothetical protein
MNQPAERDKGKKLRIWSRLQVRMAVSYIAVTLIIVLVLEFLLILIFYLVVVVSPLDRYSSW